jgi:hypothetical protein
MREVNGLGGGRAVGFRVYVCWRKIKIKGKPKLKIKKKRWETKNEKINLEGIF